MVKAQAGALDGQNGSVRFGLVSSFDPDNYVAKVLIQPEGVLSGWLPINSPWVGPGWGMASPLIPGAQVILLAQEGDAEHGVIVGAIWSAVDKPLGAPSGEFWLKHSSGSSIKLLNNGTIEIKAPQVNILGNLVVSGDVSDQAGSHKTIAAFRSAYNTHTHGDPQGGTTGIPSEVV